MELVLSAHYDSDFFLEIFCFSLSANNGVKDQIGLATNN